jgi:hypothetical protein
LRQPFSVGHRGQLKNDPANNRSDHLYPPLRKLPSEMNSENTLKPAAGTDSAAVPTPIHGNWEQERAFGQQIAPGPQKQVEISFKQKPSDSGA